MAAGLLLPLAYQNLRWGVSPIVTASDATPVSSALLTAVIGVDLAESLFQSCEVVGASTRLAKGGLPPLATPSISGTDPIS